MNLSQLNYFKKLAEVLHYTRAAQELFITQPTLSGAISSLEKELGAPLFERNRRSVLLTPYGEVFYEHVCLALRAIDDGVAAVSARSSAAFGTVNLGTTSTTQDHYLPSLIRDFEEAFDKRVIVKVLQGFTNYLTEQLHRGTLDVAFCGKRVAKMLEEADVRGVFLGYDDDVSMGSFLSYNGGNAGALMLDSLGAQLFSNLHQVRVEGIPEHFYTVYMAYHKKHVHSRAVADFIDFVKAYPCNDLIGQVLPTAPAE